MKIKITILFLVMSFFVFPAKADVSHDLQLWTPVYVTVPIKEKFKGFLEVNPRIGDNVTGIDQLVILPGIGYKLNENTTLWQGYGWTSMFNRGFPDEQRLWQRISYEKEFEKFTFEPSLRVDERFFEGAGGPSIRNKLVLKAIFPLSDRWAFSTYDSFYVNLNTVDNGPKGGFDQNRFFTGFQRKINDYANLEFGYQFQYLNRRPPTIDRYQHGILAKLYLNFE